MKQGKTFGMTTRPPLNGSEQDFDPRTHSDCHVQS
jgi:hypothetical protein